MYCMSSRRHWLGGADWLLPALCMWQLCKLRKLSMVYQPVSTTRELPSKGNWAEVTCLCPSYLTKLLVLQFLVSEPDPQKNRKEGLGNRLGWKCTVCPECRRTSNWFMIACLHTFIGNTNRNPLVQLKETENKRDLLVREVVGAQISSHWVHGQLEV